MVKSFCLVVLGVVVVACSLLPLLLSGVSSRTCCMLLGYVLNRL